MCMLIFCTQLSHHHIHHNMFHIIFIVYIVCRIQQNTMTSTLASLKVTFYWWKMCIKVVYNMWLRFVSLLWVCEMKMMVFIFKIALITALASTCRLHSLQHCLQWQLKQTSLTAIFEITTTFQFQIHNKLINRNFVKTHILSNSLDQHLQK